MSSRPLAQSTVAIVGLGLMGSSLGLALAGHCARRVGADASHVVAARALELGAVDAIGQAETVVAEADLVVLAMPVGAIISAAASIAACLRPGAVVTDIGSTKAAICDVLDQLDVASVGGHPMCGREQPGPDAARAELYDGATWVLCPTHGTDENALERVRELVRAVGASPVRMDRGAHDRAAAVASHLPYVAGQALAAVAGRADEATTGDVSVLAASGFASATRTARGSSEMWVEVLSTNADNLRAAIGDLQAELAELAALLDERPVLDDRLAAGIETLERLTPHPLSHDTKRIP